MNLLPVFLTQTTTGDEMKDFTKALKNKFKSKRSLQKHTKKGYLPVQTVLEVSLVPTFIYTRIFKLESYYLIML